MLDCQKPGSVGLLVRACEACGGSGKHKIKFLKIVLNHDLEQHDQGMAPKCVRACIFVHVCVPCTRISVAVLKGPTGRGAKLRGTPSTGPGAGCPDASARASPPEQWAAGGPRRRDRAVCR